MRTDHDDNSVSLRLALRPFVDAFRFGGRSTRTEVISFWLLGILSQLVHFARIETPSIVAQIFAGIWMILWAWPWIPLQVRRLHDQDRTGHWAWLNAGFVMLFVVEWIWAPSGDSWHIAFDWGFFRSDRSVAATPITIATTVMMIVIGIWLLVLFLSPGSGGTNRFGPDPRLDPESPLVPTET